MFLSSIIWLPSCIGYIEKLGQIIDSFSLFIYFQDNELVLYDPVKVTNSI